MPKYGTIEWLEEEYQKVSDDPWGLAWRGIECCRYNQALEILNTAVSKLSKPPKEMRILDVGCSGGGFTHRLSGLGGQVTGMDLSETAVQRARQRHPNIHFKQGSVFDCARNLETFDVIVCLEVIYYVEKSRQGAFLEALDGILAEGGMLLVSSKIGPEPYFTEEGLLNLVSKQFALGRKSCYGSEWLAKGEGIFFGLWKKAHKARNLALTGRWDGKEKIPEPAGLSPVRRAFLQKLKALAEASPFARKLIRTTTQSFITIIELGLRWSFPSEMANKLARCFNSSPTHTMLLLNKKASFNTDSPRPGVDRGVS